MAEDRTIRRRLDKMRDARRDGLRDRARRDAALAILADQGSVSTDEVDRRMDETYAEPDDRTLANMLAQKTGAAVDHERAELARAEEAAARVQDRVLKLEALLSAAREGADNASAYVAEVRERIEGAEALARMAGGMGAADEAPDGEQVVVAPDSANAAHNSGSARTENGAD